MADRARMTDRLRRLLALEGSPNAHEADAARRAAESLMARHGLRREDAAEESRTGYYELPMGASGWGAAWRFSLVTVAARHCGAEALALRAGSRRKVRIVGERCCVEAAKSCYEGLLEVVRRLEGHVASRYGDEISEIATWAGTRATSDSFRRGVVMGIARKLVRSRVPDPSSYAAAPVSPLALARVARPEVDHSDRVRAKFDPTEQPLDLDDAEVSTMFDLGLAAVQELCWIAGDGTLVCKAGERSRR